MRVCLCLSLTSGGLEGLDINNNESCISKKFGLYPEGINKVLNPFFKK